MKVVLVVLLLVAELQSMEVVVEAVLVRTSSLSSTVDRLSTGLAGEAQERLAEQELPARSS